MNIAVSDQALRNWEAALIREYLEADRTPMESAMFVSAFSQLWLFGLYELLRTWRERANEILDFVDDTKDLPQQEMEGKQSEKRKQIASRTADEPEATMRWKPFQKAADDPGLHSLSGSRGSERPARCSFNASWASLSSISPVSSNRLCHSRSANSANIHSANSSCSSAGSFEASSNARSSDCAAISTSIRNQPSTLSLILSAF